MGLTMTQWLLRQERQNDERKIRDEEERYRDRVDYEYQAKEKYNNSVEDDVYYEDGDCTPPPV